MRLQWINKKVIAWSLYDFADQAFSALFITFFFPILIKVYLGGNEFQIGLSMGLSVLFTALLVPIIGAFSDVTGRRLPILIIGTFATAVLAVLVGYVGLFVALILAFIANITHLMAKDVYDAKMIDIVYRSRLGSLSGLGLGFGYAGTIISLGASYPILNYFGWETLSAIKGVFWLSAVWYILFSFPLFLSIPDRPIVSGLSLIKAIKISVSRVKETIKNFSTAPVLGRFLIASFLYNNAMNTVVIFLGLYGREAIGLGVKEFFPVYALMALAAGLGAITAGRLADRIGPTSVIKISLVIWIFVTLLLMSITGFTGFLIGGILGGLVFGGIWALNRHMITSISPKEKIAELFGFEGLTEKFSGALGPIIFGYLAFTFSYSVALISILIFFISGLFLMRKL